MKLASLIDDYRSCEAQLAQAIQSENAAAIRELDIRMTWFRNVIRDFPVLSQDDKRLQIAFFMEVVAQTTDLEPTLPPLSDLSTIMDGHITQEMRNGEQPDCETLAMLEGTNLRVSAIGRDLRYRYASPAAGRFHNMPTEAFENLHLIDLIGRERFEKRARGYLERCFAGEDVSYCYYLDTEAHGRLLLECRMLAQYGTGDHADGAVIVLRDLTNGYTDPVKSAEANRI